MKVGILTSGGDCQGLNAVIRAIVKSLHQADDDAEVLGILNGYRGLIEGETRKITPKDVEGIINVGGSILYSSRTMFKKMLENEDREIDKMKESYKKLGLDCIFTLGGAGTHKMANLLAMEGLNVIGLPKTIDNDIWGTDITFGFHTAVDIATECIERIKTTARSHSRVFIVELMGNKAGWLTLYAGIASGADVILLPELPYDPEKVIKKVEQVVNKGRGYSIVVIAEGAKTVFESSLSKVQREMMNPTKATSSKALAEAISSSLNIDARVFVPGHLQRGGDPNAYDKSLCTQLGTFAVKLLREKKFNTTVAISGNKISYNMLSEIAGKQKLVPKNHYLVGVAKELGVSLG